MLDEKNITYDLKYEADVLPTDSKYGLIEYNKKNATSSINNGMLNIKTNSGAVYYKKDNINPNNIILIKTKGKVLSGVWYICEIIDGSKRVRCVAYPDKIILCSGQEFHVDMTKEHEIFVIKNKQINAKVYLDGKLLSRTEQLNENWGNFVGFGNGASETSDDIYIDYFYYNLNFNKDKLDELKYYLLKQNNQYYTLKSDYYKSGQYKPIAELEGKETLTQSDFETYGIDDLNLLTKTIDIDTQIVNGINKGNLGSGKYFEIPFNNDFFSISDIKITVGNKIKKTYNYISNNSIIIYNKDMLWKKIKVTCYGAKGGNGGCGYSIDKSSIQGNNGTNGEIREKIINLQINDLMELFIGQNGINGQNGSYPSSRYDYSSGQNGNAGGASGIKINDEYIFGAKGGYGGKAGIGSNHYGGYNNPKKASGNGWGYPIDELNVSDSTLLKDSSTNGEIKIEILESY